MNEITSGFDSISRIDPFSKYKWRFPAIKPFPDAS